MKHGVLQELSIADIKLDKDNPRIKQYLEYYKEITSEILALALSDSSISEATTSYRALKDSIKTSGGIIHPIVVNKESDDSYVVIEGNTRLQIYKEFDEAGAPGSWKFIPALVYDGLSETDKHEIRLQSHLVGPRDWDPYSKAKYLYHLSEEEHLPMETIISMCGGSGKGNEIRKYIDAYIYMRRYYAPYVKEQGYDFDTRTFSKFVEYQNSKIKSSIIHKGYPEEQFAHWVAEDNVDKAQLVRQIPAVLKNEEAHKAFIKKNLSEAERILHAAELAVADLSEYPYEVLAKELYRKLMDFKVAEVVSLAADPEYADKLDALETLKDKLDFIISEVKEREANG